MKLSKSLFLVFAICISLIMFGCGSSGGGGSDDFIDSSEVSDGTGTLSVGITDSAGAYKAVYVTIEGLQVHLGGNDNNKKNWKTIPMEKDTINLCELRNGVIEKLGFIDLLSGKYTQMRLLLHDTPEEDELNILSVLHPAANYVILEDDSWYEMKIPSGFQTGVKLVKGFIISKNQTTEIILDFDASRSVVEAGNSGQWLLKPTIKVLELKEYSIIEGTVTDGSKGSKAGIGGAFVSAQKYDESASDDKDKVIVQAATITDENGNYVLFVKPGTYNIVAYADGKTPDFIKITTKPGQVLDDENSIDFVLDDATDTETVTGMVTIVGEDDKEQFATLSFRQIISCMECVDGEMIEIKSVNILNMHSYTEDLTTGDYTLVASTYGYTTRTYPITVSTDFPIQQDITFN